jgi:transposase
MSLKDEDLKTAKAYHLKLTFSKLWEQETPEKAKVFLDSWYYWATHSQIHDMVKAALNFVVDFLKYGNDSGINKNQNNTLFSCFNWFLI